MLLQKSKKKKSSSHVSQEFFLISIVLPNIALNKPAEQSTTQLTMTLKYMADMQYR